MSTALLFALLSAFCVSLVSLIGGAVIAFSKGNPSRFIGVMLSLSAGLMLGNAFLHLLPEAISCADAHNQVVAVSTQNPGSSSTSVAHDHDHDHDHEATATDTHQDADEHDHAAHAATSHTAHEHSHSPNSAMILVLLGIFGFLAIDLFLHSTGKHHAQGVHPVGRLILLGDGLENFVDGLVIGAAFVVSVPIGISTTIAILLHELPIEMSDFGVLLHSGFSKKKALLWNFLSGLISLVGAAAAVLIGDVVSGFPCIVAPIAAGAFIYMAGSSLIPSIRENATLPRAGLHLLVMAIGTGIMALLLLLE